MGFLAGISWMLYRLSRENQLTLATLTDGRRAIFYGAFGMIALLIAGQDKSGRAVSGRCSGSSCWAPRWWRSGGSGPRRTPTEPAGVRARLKVLLVASMALLACAGAIAGSAAAAQRVFVKASIDSNELKVRPHVILLSGDGTLGLERVHYGTYGGAVAKASGRAYTRGCTPNCAEGKVRRPGATLRFSDLLKCEGKWSMGSSNTGCTGRC